MSVSYIDPDFKRIVKKILRENLAVQKKEKLLIASDYALPHEIKFGDIETIERIFNRLILVKKIFSVAKSELPETQVELLLYPCPWKHYSELPEDIKKQLARYDVIFVLSEFSITSEIFKMSQKKKNIRAASSPLIEESSFAVNGPLDIDINELEAEVLAVYEKLINKKKCRIYNDLGTDIHIDMNHADFSYETGFITTPNTIKNLPAGEISFGNVTINGTFVTPKGWIEGLSEDLVLTVEDSHIKKIEQKEKKADLIKKYPISEKTKIKVDQVAIGMNDKASNPYILVELVKMRGVVNLMTFQHQSDRNPLNIPNFSGNFPAPKLSLEVDGEQIIRNGKLKTNIC